MAKPHPLVSQHQPTYLDYWSFSLVNPFCFLYGLQIDLLCDYCLKAPKSDDLQSRVPDKNLNKKGGHVGAQSWVNKL